jgi:hypothetical protein
MHPPAQSPASAQQPSAAPALVNPAYLALALAAVAAMVAVVALGSLWMLTFVHLLCGLLWTGIDLFMGFVIGPVMRRIDLAARQQMIERLMPRMLFLMPVLSINTGTSGWYLAERTGFNALPYPQYAWVLTALVLLIALTVQGVGLLLPTNLRVYLELRKAEPDRARIGGLMRRYVRMVSLQGVLQIVMILIMARFGSGLGG